MNFDFIHYLGQWTLLKSKNTIWPVASFENENLEKLAINSGCGACQSSDNLTLCPIGYIHEIYPIVGRLEQDTSRAPFVDKDPLYHNVHHLCFDNDGIVVWVHHSVSLIFCGVDRLIWRCGPFGLGEKLM